MSEPGRGTLAEGWRLYAEHERGVMPRNTRVLIVAIGAAVSIVGAAVASLPVFVDPSATTPGQIGTALGFGLLAGCLAAAATEFVVSRRARKRTLSTTDPATAETHRFGPSVFLADGVWREIGRAYRNGREPESPLDERVKAVQVAEVQRVVLPGQVRFGLAAVPFIVPIVLLMVSLWPTVSFFLAPLYWLLYSGRAVTHLWVLGQTTAAIATAPSLPEGYIPAPTKKRGWVPPKPYKQLGTSNPDDYSRD